MRLSLFATATTVMTAPALAQDMPTPAIDPGVAAQGALIRGTMEGHAERDGARLRGERPGKAVSDACAAAWQRRDRMSRAERIRLYDRCPR